MKKNTLFHENIYTEALIETSAEKLWSIISNFNQYKDWNIPLLLSGQCKLNAPLIVQANISGRKPQKFVGRLLVCREMKELEWVGHKIAPVIFSGKHAFIIESIDDAHVTFINKESFSGFAVPFIKKNLLRTKIKDFHNETNLVIKRLAETL